MFAPGNDVKTLLLTAAQTRMQILNPTPSAVYNGMIQGGYRIATGEGVLSLWRGMSSVVVGAGWYIWRFMGGKCSYMYRTGSRSLLCYP